MSLLLANLLNDLLLLPRLARLAVEVQRLLDLGVVVDGQLCPALAAGLQPPDPVDDRGAHLGQVVVVPPAPVPPGVGVVEHLGPTVSCQSQE